MLAPTSPTTPAPRLIVSTVRMTKNPSSAPSGANILVDMLVEAVTAATMEVRIKQRTNTGKTPPNLIPPFLVPESCAWTNVRISATGTTVSASASPIAIVPLNAVELRVQSEL